MNRGVFLPESEGQGMDVEYLRQKADKKSQQKSRILYCPE